MIQISVIVPTHNREKTISKCLNSIIGQTYPVSEIIIVDDCSNDKTLNVIASFNDQRIKVIHLEKNIGAQAARNIGIKEAQHDWIALNDSDDEWLPNRLELGISKLKKNCLDPFTFIYSSWIEIDHQSNTQKIVDLPFLKSDSTNNYKKILSHPGPMFQSMLTSKSAFETIGYNDENTPSHDEWETSIRLSKICKTYKIEEPTFIYHVNQGECISANTRRTVIGYKYVIEKHKNEIVQQCGYNIWFFHIEMYARLMLKHRCLDDFKPTMAKLFNEHRDINCYKLALAYLYNIRLELLDAFFKSSFSVKAGMKMKSLLNLLCYPLISKVRK